MEVIEDIVKKLAPTPVTPLFTELPGETVWKVSKRVGSRFSVARSAENCAISPPRAGSWDHETKPVRSFQTVSRRILLGNPYLCARISIQDRERFRPCPPVLPIEAQAPCNGYK